MPFFAAEARPIFSYSSRAGLAFGKNSARIGIQLEDLDLLPYCSSDAAAVESISRSSSGVLGADGANAVRGSGGGAGSGGGGGKTLIQGASDVKVHKYDLAALTHHTGSLDGGHYTAQCRHPASRTWHGFNDAVVSDTVPTALSASAYVLFYMRQQ